MSEPAYIWLNGEQIPPDKWDLIDALLSKRRWMSLSRDFSRLLMTETPDGPAFCVFQAIGYCGPLYVPPKQRGTGIAQKLANDMVDELIREGARGWMAVAESPYAEQVCKARGMVRIEHPVYMMPYAGGLD